MGVEAGRSPFPRAALKHGDAMVLVQQTCWLERGTTADSGFGQRWQNHDSLQAQGRGGRHPYRPNGWFQRGDGELQEYKVTSVGPRRSDLHQALLAMLLCRHEWDHIRG